MVYTHFAFDRAAAAGLPLGKHKPAASALQRHLAVAVGDRIYLNVMEV